MFRDGIVKRGGSAVSHRAKNIAFGQNSENAALRVGDDRSANFPRRQQRGSFGQGPVRLGGYDVPSLCRKNARDNHGCNPYLISIVSRFVLNTSHP
jgi:hypothetical protein